MSLYLTFDIGTTALKTALITDEGCVLDIYTSEYTAEFPQSGWVEMPPDTYWNAAVQGTHEVFTRSGADSSSLTAIGFSSQGQTFIPIDRNGSPLYNAIVWMDNRAEEIAASWESEWLSCSDYHHISGYPYLHPSLEVFKIAWLGKNAHPAHHAWKFLCLPDYLTYRMTGEVSTDYVMAQFTGLYDIHAQDWDRRLVEAAGITIDQLPEVYAPGFIVGRLQRNAAEELGVPAGTAVCTGANDQLAGALGAGNASPGIISETTGGVMAVVASTDSFSQDKRMFTGNHVYAGLYYDMAFTNSSAVVLKWFRELCAADQDYNLFLKGVEAVPPGCDGLSVLPHFAGSGMPTCNKQAKGAFVGLTLSNTREHITRAIMESCCCQLKECLDFMSESGCNVSSIRSLGGAAHSDLWLQMKADMLKIPVERPVCSDAASLGAAMLAATGVGQFDSPVKASLEWYRTSKIFDPNVHKHSLYLDVYYRYLKLYDQLYGDNREIVQTL